MRTTVGPFLAGLGVLLIERPARVARHVANRSPQQHGLGRVALFPPLAAISLALGWALTLAVH